MDEIAISERARRRAVARWPAALTALLLLALLVAVPRSVHLLPQWVLYATSALVVLPMVGAALRRGQSAWTRAEHWAMVLFFFIAAPITLATLAVLVIGMARGAAGFTGIELFVCSSLLWIVNVLIFALVFWHVDGGGPQARINEPRPRPDWLFPQYELPSDLVEPGWRPSFVDYLYLAVATATSFSTTDVAPLTARAKRLMMIELAVSLVTIVVVGARAVNILGN